MSDESRRQRWMRIAVEAWAVIGIIVLLAAAGWLFGRMSAALVPFGIAFIVVVLLRGPVDFLSSRKVPRGLSVASCYLGGLLVASLAFVFVVPVFAAQISAFASALPGYLDKGYALWAEVTAPKGQPVVPGWVTTVVLNVKDSSIKSIAAWSGSGLSIAFAAGSQAVTLVFNAVLAAIISFYTLLDLDKISEEAMRLVPQRFRVEVTHGLATVSRVLGGWARGALLDALAVGTLISIGLAIVGVPYALAIGIIGGVLNVVPYLGPVIAAVLAGLSGLVSGVPLTAVWAVAIVLSVQQFDNLWLNPRIMSQNVDLHPVLVVFSLLTGATLFGVPGMLLAVPVAAIVKGLFVYYFERQTQQSLRTDDGALFKTQRSTDEPDDVPEASDDTESES
jgi:predicted PurR-regulated permease PerM